MKLKAVELQGFKSFPDKTKLTFDDGVTVIVGPNGSGKSNISDAIKWVFGEQSAKSLRGSNMEDVIFGGSQSRNPMGYAWVSLYIDNTDRELDVDSDEVIITRRLYRNGGSEYRINNNLVRLKDVYETFMDTGLGRDGYSIIEQGRIADIVSAKSNQRREIFEEAAGISKFRYRKTEAEHKLVQAEEDLVRLRDIMGELENRVGPLKEQSDKAKKYVVLADEKKILEVSLWIAQLNSLKDTIRALNDSLLIANSDRNKASKKLEEAENQLEILDGKITETKVFLEQQREKSESLNIENNEAEKNIAIKNNDISHNNTSIDNYDRELNQYILNDSEYKNQLDSLGIELKNKSDENAESEKDLLTLQGQLDQLMTDENQAKTERDNIVRQKETLQQQLQNAQIDSERSSALIGETISRLNELKDNIQLRDDNLNSLRKTYQDHAGFVVELNEKLDSYQNSKNGYLFKMQSKDNKRNDLIAKLAGFERQISEKKQKAQVLNDLEKNHDSFSTSVKFVMKQAENNSLRGIIGPVSTVIHVENQYATAIEITLGGAIQNIVTEDETAAKRAISLLKEQKAGRVTFLPVTNIKGNEIKDQTLLQEDGVIGLASQLVHFDSKYKDIVSYLLGRTIICEDIEVASRLSQKQNHAYRIVTLDGQVINAGGSLTGGSFNKSASILNRKTEIEKLNEEVEAILVQKDSMEKEREELDREINGLQASIDAIEADEKNAKDDLIQANTLASHYKKLVEEAEDQARISLENLDAMTVRISELKGQEMDSQGIQNALAGEIEKCDNNYNRLGTKLDSLGNQIAEMNQSVMDGRIIVAENQKDLKAIQDRLDLMIGQRDGNTSRKEEIVSMKEDLIQQNNRLFEEISVLQNQCLENKDTLETVASRIAKARDEINQYEMDIKQYRDIQNEAIKNKTSAESEVNNLNEKVASLETREDSISTQMWDEYELTKTDAVQIAEPIENLSESNRKLQDIKSKIRSLGAVNTAAIEEYEEVSTRYEFMKEQITDAENAKNTLTQLISELASQMSELFVDKFNQINNYFGSIFKELFNGGHAELKLSEPNNPLETGIDISVQPPGKIIKNLSALSGGEQAFVAICIYFAILKVNPAPFVLIDEIEAALDDVNVTRFASYLHKMTKKTQFICISHRRGTMEEGDVLYGVTMEEEGISKMLRLNVAEMDEKFASKLS